jgi:4,4'-diaponeurosporenoate glycosyltransferase
MSGTRLALETLRWLVGIWLLWSIPRCRPTGPAALDRVAVIVPARDEERTLPTLLASLARQEPGPAEVLVVDDSSTDGTVEVARRAGATVVPCGPLPPGWTGKSWACWTGTQATAAPTLVFLDADTEVAPGGLARVVGEHARRGGLVSVQPFHVTERPYERLSAFFNVVSMMGVDAFGPAAARRARSATGAFGPCLVASRDDYAAAGGHEAVRAEVVEDVALAHRFTEAGRPVACLGGRGTVAFRMYPGGARQLVEGWTKNFATGAGATRPLTFVLISVWLSGVISAAWYLGAGTIGRGAAVAVYAAYAAQLAWMLARVGRFGAATPLAYPVPLAFFLVVFVRSLVLTHVRGEVRWRGRAVAAGRRAGR